LESAAQALETAIEELTDIKNALHAAPSYNEGPEGVRVCATFVPEAWQNNNAVEVDPEGETEIDITAEVLAMGKEKALQLKDKSLDVDAFQHAAMVPKWIKNWHGPFSIHVEDSIAEYFEAIEQQGKGEQA
jgi:ABC-type metal ion transport system substrate-binding protein